VDKFLPDVPASGHINVAYLSTSSWAQYYNNTISILDYTGIALWIIGFCFEAGGDFQLSRFKAELSNKGKVMDKGFWHYTRHPNYFRRFICLVGIWIILSGLWQLSPFTWIGSYDSTNN